MIKKLSTFIYSLLFMTSAAMCWAENTDVELHYFEADSLEEIVSSRTSQTFMVVMWSIDCPPCLKELALFRQHRDRLSQQNLVLISTDDLQYVDAIEETLKEFELGFLDNWIFSGSLPERLRYVIDPNWYGELPRTYFYGREGQRKAHSGLVTEQLLNEWLAFSDSDSSTAAGGLTAVAPSNDVH